MHLSALLRTNLRAQHAATRPSYKASFTGCLPKTGPKTGIIRIADLTAPNRDPALAQALKARAKELERLGLAKAVRRNVLAFSANWQDRLKAMELHLDVAKRMAQARQAQSLTQMLGLGKGGGKER